MIRKPKVGKRVVVNDREHCYGLPTGAHGIIIKVYHKDSFEVKSDSGVRGRFSRLHCRKCVDPE